MTITTNFNILNRFLKSMMVLLCITMTYCFICQTQPNVNWSHFYVNTYIQVVSVILSIIYFVGCFISENFLKGWMTSNNPNLVALFNSPNWTFLALFKELLSIQNVNVVRFARHVEWDFFFDFQTTCILDKAEFSLINWSASFPQRDFPIITS